MLAAVPAVVELLLWLAVALALPLPRWVQAELMLAELMLAELRVRRRLPRRAPTLRGVTREPRWTQRVPHGRW